MPVCGVRLVLGLRGRADIAVLVVVCALANIRWIRSDGEVFYSITPFVMVASAPPRGDPFDGVSHRRSLRYEQQTGWVFTLRYVREQYVEVGRVRQIWCVYTSWLNTMRSRWRAASYYSASADALPVRCCASGWPV